MCNASIDHTNESRNIFIDNTRRRLRSTKISPLQCNKCALVPWRMSLNFWLQLNNEVDVTKICSKCVSQDLKYIVIVGVVLKKLTSRKKKTDLFAFLHPSAYFLMFQFKLLNNWNLEELMLHETFTQHKCFVFAECLLKICEFWYGVKILQSNRNYKAKFSLLEF